FGDKMSYLALKALKNIKFKPYWLDNIGDQEIFPSLQENINCDLLVVGGGYTGLWSALLAKEANPEKDIVLIEAKSVAIGASGRPGGIVSTSLMHGMGHSLRLFPDELSELETLGKKNLDDFRATIEHHNIDCDLEWTGELTVSVGKQGMAVIDEEYELHNQYGHTVKRLSKIETQAEINSPLFEGSFWNKIRSGTVHPAKLAIGLKKACVKIGVRIYENTPLTSSNYNKCKVSVSTPNGVIKANKVMLATNAFASGHKKIKHRVAAIRDRIIITEPLTGEQMACIGWQNRQGVYDTRTQLNYMRLTKDNRILFGGRLGYYFGNNTDPQGDKETKPYIRLAEAFLKTFPSLQDVKFSHAWSGPIALTTRMAVHYQSYFSGNMVFTGGYSGFGITASRFGARVGLDILDKKDTVETRLGFAKTKPGYIPPEPFRYIGAQITLYALDTIDEKGGWRIPWIKVVEKMGFPLFI
ncbi:MAG: NAD(P)/FAD-dependent oxidoreductase, partial [Sphingomonadales bacterium]